MKKFKWLKVLSAFALSLAIASSACACSFSDIFSGGNDQTPSASEEETDAQIRSIYDLYVESCEKSGDAPLTYEKWLASIKGEKGDEGDKGDKGDKGNGWLYGEGAPQNSLGVNGDLYLDYKNWDVYTKDNGSWTKRGNIKGEKGDKGDPGTSGGTTDPGADDGRTAELQIHFLELGNKNTGDCIYIKVGDVDILVDGGSRESSADTIEGYVDTYCTDNTLEYVIVTHADQDHIAAWAGNGSNKSLFERFECEKIIDFPLSNKDSQVYGRYKTARDDEVALGAVHYTALECYNNVGDAKRSYELSEGITLNFLYNYYYDHNSSDENNYSVCFYINQGENNYLFTGDLEEKGEEYLVQYNQLPKCKLFKAGHHGSKTSSNECLLEVIQPEYVCVCCCAGSTEYGGSATVKDYNNTFPTQDMITRVAKYTKNIYVTTLATGIDLVGWSWSGFTSMNGNIVVKSDGVDFSIHGSNNDTILKDTEWFQQYRTWPANGVQ